MTKSARLGDTVFYLLTVGILVASALFYLWQGFRIMNLKWEISALESEHESLVRRGDLLREELLKLSDLSRLEKSAERLGLVRPEAQEMLVLSRNLSHRGTKRFAGDAR
ncbi:MAG: hypothetical protein JW759_03560 [Candidatus Coatesbacteria bacterium]|nr:hypothetical protein [Candidatus Coatesbacteria bacterium]